jgi:protein SCO1/2
MTMRCIFPAPCGDDHGMSVLSPRGALRALVALSLILAAGTTGLVLAGTRGGDAATAAPGLRAGALPVRLDGAPAPRIRLPDAHGGTFDSRTLAGRPHLVTFLYTSCPDVCPLIGEEIAEALRRLGPRRERVAAVAVSVDPRGDTPAAARRWLELHRLPARMHYVVGSGEQLTPVWRDWYQLPAGQRRLDPETHAAGVWLVDARGRLRGRWPAGAPLDPAALAHDLEALS